LVQWEAFVEKAVAPARRAKRLSHVLGGIGLVVVLVEATFE
jgi:hypothetical protein